MKTTYLVICALIISLTGFGQITIQSKKIPTKPETHLEGHRIIELKNKSKIQDVVIPVEKGVLTFNLRITGTLTCGKLTVEVYDPKGVKQSYLTIKTQLGANEVATGAIRKSLNDPQAGSWKIKIIPKEATGYISLTSATTK